MRKKTVWNGEYKGICFEIQNFTLGDRDAWAFYLSIPLDALPENMRERFWLPPIKNDTSFRIHYDYSSEPLIRDIEWNCGCTYYEKFGLDGGPRMVKIGCDYQHYWDDGHYHDSKILEMDAKGAIDSLLKMVPNILNRCQWNGKYYPADMGSRREDGCWYSNEGWELSEKIGRGWIANAENRS